MANAIADIIVDENSPNTEIDLSNVFSDADGDAMEFSVINNTQNLVAASISGDTLILDFLDNKSGTTQIVVTATANNQSVNDLFRVTVNPLNPVINPIEVTTGRDIIPGETGDDLITGYSGSDQMSGNRGSDTFNLSSIFASSKRKFVVNPKRFIVL